LKLARGNIGTLQPVDLFVGCPFNIGQVETGLKLVLKIEKRRIDMIAITRVRFVTDWSLDEAAGKAATTFR